MFCVWYSFLLLLQAFDITGSMSSWPKGVYGLLKPSTGCPSTEWDSKGFLFQDTVDVNPSNNRSEILHVDGHVDPSYVMRLFCLKRSSTGSEAWPKGQYCIYKRENGTLPGMDWGWMRMRDEYSDNRDVAELTSNPILRIKKDNRIIDFYFYCNTKGNKKIPIELPITKPFYLLPFGSSECQQVKWMVATTEWIKYHTRDYQGHHYKGGTVPYYELGNINDKGITMYYCYYESCNYTLTKNKGVFQSPNFPHKYPDGQMCSWRIMVPANHTIYVHFSNFSLYENNKKDVLNFYENDNGLFKIKRKYHGAEPPFTLTATSNLLLEFLSNKANSSMGFRAEYYISSTPSETTSKTTSTVITTTKLNTEFLSTTKPTTENLSNNRTGEMFKKLCISGRDGTGMIVVVVIPLVCFILVIAIVTDIVYRCRTMKTNNEKGVARCNDNDAINPTYDQGSILMNQPNASITTINGNQMYQTLSREKSEYETPDYSKKKTDSADTKMEPDNPEYIELEQGDNNVPDVVYHELEGPDPIGPSDDHTYQALDKQNIHPLYQQTNSATISRQYNR